MKLLIYWTVYSFSAPEEVKNLTAETLSPEKVLLLWNDPCPPNGIIRNVAFRYVSKDHEQQLDSKGWAYRSAGETVCMASSDYDRCLEIDDLIPNTHYVYQVNNFVCSIFFWFTFSSYKLCAQSCINKCASWYTTLMQSLIRILTIFRTYELEFSYVNIMDSTKTSWILYSPTNTVPPPYTHSFIEHFK